MKKEAELDLLKLKEGIAVMKKFKKLNEEVEDDEIVNTEVVPEVPAAEIPAEEKDKEVANEAEDLEDENSEDDAEDSEEDYEKLSEEEEMAAAELDDKLDDEKLSESVKTKIKKLLSIKEAKQVKILESKFAKYKKLYEAESEEKQDAYLSSVADEWLDQNREAVENSIKTKIAEGFIEDFKDLMKKYNLNITEEEANLADQYKQENDELKDEVNQKVTESVQLKRQLKEAKKAACIQKMLREAVEAGVAKSERIKLRKLAEEVEYNDNDDQFIDDLDRKADSIEEDDSEEIPSDNTKDLDIVIPEEPKDDEIKEPTLDERINNFLNK